MQSAFKTESNSAAGTMRRGRAERVCARLRVMRGMGPAGNAPGDATCSRAMASAERR